MTVSIEVNVTVVTNNRDAASTALKKLVFTIPMVLLKGEDLLFSTMVLLVNSLL